MRATRFGFTAAAAAVLLGASAPPVENPLLPYAARIGGARADVANAVAFGPDGALWIAGTSNSADLAGDRLANAWSMNVFVMRLHATTHRVLSIAWLAGTYRDDVAGIAFDAAGDAYIAGTSFGWVGTAATGFGPGGAYGGYHPFVARVRRDGTGFVWAASLGGSYDEVATGLAVAPDGHPVVCGWSVSRDFPLRDSLREPHENYIVAGDGGDAFVTRLSADGSKIEFSTLVGGGKRDQATAVAVTPEGSLVVAGTTWSPDFPAGLLLRGAAAPSESAAQAFLVEIETAPAALARGALLGTVTPASFSVSADDVLLLAQSKLVEGRMTFDPVPYSPAGPPGDALLVRLAGGDWSVAREASFGGSGDEDLVAMTRAADGTIWVGGSTTSADLPVAGAVQPLPGSGPGGTDAFVAAFDPDDLSVRFATYLGGSAAERAGGIAAAPDGSAWIVGATASEDFPETEGSATGVGKITDPPVRGARSGHYDLHVANLRRGDAALRPAAPTDLSATVLDANTVRLAWGGASDGFAVLRRDRAGWSRVAQVAAGTTEWTDVRAPAGRELTYAVQALSAAGGSAPSFAEAVTPATLDVRVVSGDARAVSSEPVRTNLFRAAGTLAVGASSIDAAFNPRRDGFDCTMLTDDGGEEAVISIPANDRRWRRTGRTWRWASDGMRLTFQPATGRFDIRVASYWRSLWPLGASPRPLRVTVGNDAGSVTPEWKIVSAHHAAVR